MLGVGAGDARRVLEEGAQLHRAGGDLKASVLESLNVEEVLNDGRQTLALLDHRGQHVLAFGLGVLVLGEQAGVGDQAGGRGSELVADHGKSSPAAPCLVLVGRGWPLPLQFRLMMIVGCQHMVLVPRTPPCCCWLLGDNRVAAAQTHREPFLRHKARTPDGQPYVLTCLIH